MSLADFQVLFDEFYEIEAEISAIACAVEDRIEIANARVRELQKKLGDLAIAMSAVEKG